MKLILVSNRLPFTMVKREDGYSLQESAGGLVSGLGSYLQLKDQVSTEWEEHLWVGWPGIEIDEASKSEWKHQLARDKNIYPVFLENHLMDKFYNGFCNETLWPLFHYFPSYALFDESSWEFYEAVNIKFAEAVAEVAKPGDVVWVHDYHLMLLPELLRKKIPGLKISFFLHIPFPSFEIFRLLPDLWRKKILQGVLGADLIGFHTHDYSQSFLRCCSRILGYEHQMGLIQVEGRLLKVDTFPMGIEYSKYAQLAHSETVISDSKKLKQSLEGQKILLSVDRLDYSKGIAQRLEAYEYFLEQYPEWRGKITYVLLLVPSRTSVNQYQEMKRYIDESVGRINGKYGLLEWSPIYYMYKSVSLHELVVLYAASDIVLVTPLRDGMNLVAKEFVASRAHQTGVLILSELVGASRELGEALQVNPRSKNEIISALNLALNMSLPEQVSRISAMQKRLKSYDVVRWVADNMYTLQQVQKEQQKFYSKLLRADKVAVLVDHFQSANKRILFFDYDGTLVPLTALPEQALPNQELLNVLETLVNLPNTELVIISGRPREFLWECFGHLPAHFVAEHGVWVKRVGEDWGLIKNMSHQWKKQIYPSLQRAADRLPGAFVEEKVNTLVWHYRKCDPELSALREKELLDDLIQFTANADLQILQGNKILEVRNSGVSKGNAVLQFVSSHDYDFILAVGDDTTDEEMFKMLPSKAVSVRVGICNTFAQYNIFDSEEVLRLIECFVK